MTIERLKALAEAYGADLRRWPASERPFAESLIATDPAARAALEEAAALDVLLDASPRPVPSAVLAARILAAAPKAREARAHLGRIFWFLGAGWAAAACAGVVAGVGLTTHLTADEQADAILYQATLSGVDDTEVLG
jgi:anti-sigma factor RsiW